MPRLFRNVILLCLFFCWLSASAQAQRRIDCNALESRILKQAMHYCVLLPDSYDVKSKSTSRYPVLYFLHGLGDNEQTLINTGAWNLIENLRQQHKIGDFLIVTPEGNRSFYINSADRKTLYSDFFLREFMPAIEAKYRIKAGRAARGVTGMSMGGYGALRFAFAYPQLFSAVSAQSPALVTGTPQEFNTALRSSAQLSEMLGGVFGQPMNVPHWQQNNVFTLAAKNKVAMQSLAIYFNCGQADNYGFEKGTEALHQQLKKEAIKHEYHLYPGDHSLNHFLGHMAETMEFHSRAFEAAK